MMQSWIANTVDSDFGIENLPLGIYAPPQAAPRAGVAIGEHVADLGALIHAGLLEEPTLAGATSLNAFLAAGRGRWRALRARLQQLFGEQASEAERGIVQATLVPRAEITMQLPIVVHDYVDFYSSIEHATNVGRIFRPTDPLLPNYRYVPIGYHGRAGTVVVDGTPIRRPHGQTKAPDEAAPSFGPSRMLDFELELGFVTGAGPALGEPIPIANAREHIYGFVLLDDWSARDIQAWEYQPLGPLLSKSFATSISPWLVSLDALEPFRVPNRVIDPPALPYLHTDESWAYDIELEVLLETPKMRAEHHAPATIARTNFRDMYWNAAQQLAHLTSNGATIAAGDLCGSGTISGTEPGSYGSLIELTKRGAEPITFTNGETRAFLLDGDTVIMRGRAVAGGLRVGLGEVRGTITG